MEIFLWLMLVLGAGIFLFNRIARLTRERDAARQTQQQLAAEIERWRAQNNLLIQNIAEGILIIDARKQIVSINEVAREILGAPTSLDQLARVLPIEQLDLLLDAPAESVSQTLALQGRLLEIHAHTIDQPAPLALIVLRDVTELQRLGRVRRDFVANLSHELRTPITSLRLLTDTIANELNAQRPLAADWVLKLRHQVAVLHQLTEEMMTLALIESGQMPIQLLDVRVVDLANHAIDMLRAQADQKNIRINIDVPSDLRTLADPNAAPKVFNNLLHNAIKFTPPHGTIHLRAQQSGENIHIEIADSGIGIPARDLPHIFERFYKVDAARTSSASRGTGLGLAIAKHIVEGHGGKIWAESITGQGSTFHFTLPACETDAA